MRRLAAGFVALAIAVAAFLWAQDDEAPSPDMPTEPSLLSFLAQVPERGRYEARVASLEGTAAPLSIETGHFWKTRSGVVTRTHPFDEAVVRRHLRELRRRVDPIAESAGESTAATDVDRRALYLLLDNRYEGRDFQYDLSYFALMALLTQAPTTNPIAVRVREPCRKAFQAYQAAVAREVAAMEPSFARDATGRDTWTIFTNPLDEATEEEWSNAGRACGIEHDGPTLASGCELRVERAETSVSVRAIGCSGLDDDEPLVSMTASGADIGAAPRSMEPVSAFDPVSRFILKLNQCGGLPWEYTNFAAADTYTPPDDKDYLGPTPLVSHYLCEHEVPPARREEARRS